MKTTNQSLVTAMVAMAILALSATASLGGSEGVTHHFRLLSSSPTARVAVPLVLGSDGQLEAIRFHLKVGTSVESVHVHPEGDNGVPDTGIGMVLGENIYAASTGWTVVEGATPIDLDAGRHWISMRVASVDRSSPGGGGLGFAYAKGSVVLCGSEVGEWQPLADTALAIEPRIRWNAAAAGKSAATQPPPTEEDPQTLQAMYLGTYPNPASDGTSFAFRLGSEGSVTVAIFNVRGERVRTLGPMVIGPGDHQVSWDGRATNGSIVASGVYYARFNAPGIETRVPITVLW